MSLGVLRGFASKAFLSFTVVGALGFFVDAGVLLMAAHLGLGLYAGRVCSYLAAATFTWVLNRNFTFQTQRSSSLLQEWFLYLISQLSGAAVNLLLYSALIYFSPFFHSRPILAVAAGSIAGLLANFSASRLVLSGKQP